MYQVQSNIPKVGPVAETSQGGELLHNKKYLVWGNLNHHMSGCWEIYGDIWRKHRNWSTDCDTDISVYVNSVL